MGEEIGGKVGRNGDELKVEGEKGEGQERSWGGRKREEGGRGSIDHSWGQRLSRSDQSLSPVPLVVTCRDERAGVRRDKVLHTVPRLS